MFVTSGKVFGGWFDSWRLSPRTPRSYIAPGPNCPRFRRRRSVFVGRPVLVSVGRPCYPSNVGVGCMAEVSHNRVRRVGHVRGRPDPNLFSGSPPYRTRERIAAPAHALITSLYILCTNGRVMC